jgi:hypothetical protein
VRLWSDDSQRLVLTAIGSGAMAGGLAWLGTAALNTSYPLILRLGPAVFMLAVATVCFVAAYRRGGAERVMLAKAIAGGLNFLQPSPGFSLLDEMKHWERRTADGLRDHLDPAHAAAFIEAGRQANGWREQIQAQVAYLEQLRSQRS